MAGILAKSGKDSIDIAGHKVPIALLAGGVALIGVIVVLRARSQAQPVASIGQPSAPMTAADAGFGLLPAPDNGAALANISQQLTSLQQGINTAPAAPPSQIASFSTWLGGNRPDLVAAENAGRWGDIYGQYVKEVAGAQAAGLR
jgi:hypothetical protein